MVVLLPWGGCNKTLGELKAYAEAEPYRSPYPCTGCNKTLGELKGLPRPGSARS